MARNLSRLSTVVVCLWVCGCHTAVGVNKAYPTENYVLPEWISFLVLPTGYELKQFDSTLVSLDTGSEYTVMRMLPGKHRAILDVRQSWSGRTEVRRASRDIELMLRVVPGQLYVLYDAAERNGAPGVASRIRAQEIPLRVPSRDGSRVTWFAPEEGRVSVHVRGMGARHYRYLPKPVSYRPGSQHLALLAGTEESVAYLVDGREADRHEQGADSVVDFATAWLATDGGEMIATRP